MDVNVQGHINVSVNYMNFNLMVVMNIHHFNADICLSTINVVDVSFIRHNVSDVDSDAFGQTICMTRQGNGINSYFILSNLYVLSLHKAYNEV